MALNTITQVKLLNGKVIDLVNWTDQPLFSSADFQSGFTQQETSLFQYVVGDPVPGVGLPAAAVTRRTASENDTNISTPGSMASTEEMLVYAIKPEYYFYNTETVNDFTTRTYEGAVPSEDDLLASDESICSTPAPTAVGLWILAQQLLLRLIISQKVYAEASIAYFNTGFGPFGQQTDLGLGSLVGAPVQSMANGGFPSQEAVRSFVIPHHMGSQEKYRVNIVNAGGEPVSFGKGFQYPGTCSNTPRVMMSLRINLDGLYKRPTA